MPGHGEIGGGGSIYLNFSVDHGPARPGPGRGQFEDWSAFDLNASKVTVTLPPGMEKDKAYELTPGDKIKIDWA